MSELALDLFNAISEIVKLRKRIAELEEAQRWIPVSERLPEDGETVLAFDENDASNADLSRYTIGKYRDRTKAEYLRKWTFLNDIWADIEVTHWMPLPKSPEVQE